MPEYSRIKMLREEKELTQKQVADALFMQLTQYRRYETGERELPLDIAISIAKLYNVPIDYIAGISDKIQLSKYDLTKEEAELLNMFRTLPDSSKSKLFKICQILK